MAQEMHRAKILRLIDNFAIAAESHIRVEGVERGEPLRRQENEVSPSTPDDIKEASKAFKEQGTREHTYGDQANCWLRIKIADRQLWPSVPNGGGLSRVKSRYLALPHDLKLLGAWKEAPAAMDWVF